MDRELSMFDLLEEKNIDKYAKEISELSECDTEYSAETTRIMKELVDRMIEEKEAFDSKPKWTRGKWTAYTDNILFSGHAYVIADDKYHVAEIPDTGCSKETAGNTRLIAAAPDMYNSIVEMVAYFEVVREREERIKYGGLEIDKRARLALDKAHTATASPS